MFTTLIDREPAFKETLRTVLGIIAAFALHIVDLCRHIEIKSSISSGTGADIRTADNRTAPQATASERSGRW